MSTVNTEYITESLLELYSNTFNRTSCKTCKMSILLNFSKQSFFVFDQKLDEFTRIARNNRNKNSHPFFDYTSKYALEYTNKFLQFEALIQNLKKENMQEQCRKFIN